MSKRDYSLDFLRVIACILVIVIHVANIYCRAYASIDDINYIGAVIFNAIARISVPIFFMISGALLIKNSEFDMKKYFKRIWRLLFALIIWNIFYYLFNFYYLGTSSNLFDTFIESFFVPTKRHLWFIYAIIGIYIALPFVQKMCHNLSEKEENLFMGLYLFFVGFVYVFRKEFNQTIDNPIPIIQATYYLGYFVIGHILYKRVSDNKIDKKWNKYLILLPIVCLTITILYTLKLSGESHSFDNTYLAYRSIFYILSSVSIFLLFVMYKEKFKYSKLIASISNLSFGIYLIHPVFQNIITENIAITQQLTYIYIPVYTLIIFLCAYFSAWIISKIPYLNKILG